jgi:hypothetical protein
VSTSPAKLAWHLRYAVLRQRARAERPGLCPLDVAFALVIAEHHIAKNDVVWSPGEGSTTSLATRKRKGLVSCVGSLTPTGKLALDHSWTTKPLGCASLHKGETAVATIDKRQGPDGKPVYRVRVVCLASYCLVTGASPVVVSARAPRSRLPVLLGDRGC